jgi:hypothetical protein
MNVTITLDDDLCREARHRAVDEGKSLSSWLAGVIRKEVGKTPAAKSPSLLEMLRDDSAGNVPLEFPPMEDELTPANLDA